MEPFDYNMLQNLWEYALTAYLQRRHYGVKMKFFNQIRLPYGAFSNITPPYEAVLSADTLSYKELKQMLQSHIDNIMHM